MMDCNGTVYIYIEFFFLQTLSMPVKLQKELAFQGKLFQV